MAILRGLVRPRILVVLGLLLKLLAELLIVALLVVLLVVLACALKLVVLLRCGLQPREGAAIDEDLNCREEKSLLCTRAAGARGTSQRARRCSSQPVEAAPVSPCS